MLGTWGYSRFRMNDAFGLILFIVFIACIIGVAAGLTWVVVRLSPKKKPDSAAAGRPGGRERERRPRAAVNSRPCASATAS